MENEAREQMSEGACGRANTKDTFGKERRESEEKSISVSFVISAGGSEGERERALIRRKTSSGLRSFVRFSFSGVVVVALSKPSSRRSFARRFHFLPNGLEKRPWMDGCNRQNFSLDCVFSP